MKRLALLILIITLPILTYFQYQKYRRFHPPTEYDYTLSDSIDTNYYNPATLQQYYRSAYEIGQFARQQWHNHGVDVRYPDDDSEAQRAAQYYQQLLSTTAQLEDQLATSYQLKQAGFDNLAIAQIEQEGLSPTSYRLAEEQDLLELAKGDKGHRVWALQKLLVQHGYDIPVDGIFSKETEGAVKDLQQKTDNYPSGSVDEPLLRVLTEP